jgi:hypothetical protein
MSPRRRIVPDPAAPDHGRQWNPALRDNMTGEVFSTPGGIHADLLVHIPEGHAFTAGCIEPSSGRFVLLAERDAWIRRGIRR